jgi:hypothetical protein
MIGNPAVMHTLSLAVRVSNLDATVKESEIPRRRQTAGHRFGDL